MTVPDERGTRKLAAIMFTDMKDFSRKMQTDELSAFEILRNHDAILHEIVQKHGGRVIKSVGDSFMVDFSSAVNAVKSAVEAQETFWKYNESKSDFDRIQIRIGIHLGDVIDVGNDMYGDGVNIASRIESITEPTRICVSQDIYNQIKNKLPIKATRIGQVQLKNILEPIEVYELMIDSIPELAIPSKKALEADAVRKAEATSRQEAEEAHRIEEARRQREDEHTTKAQEHYQRAEQLFSGGNIDSAVLEIEEVFKLVPIHSGAQSLQMKIDAFRFQQEEERRLKQAAEARKAKEEQEKRIQTIIDTAERLLGEKQFDEALHTLQEVFSLNPNHPTAREIESRIQEASRLQESPAPMAVEVQEQPIEPKKAPPPRPSLGLRAKPKRSVPWAKIIGTVVVIALAGAGYLFYPLLKTMFFPVRASLVVLAEGSNNAEEDQYLGPAFAGLLADRFASQNHLTVIAPSSTILFHSRSLSPGQIQKEFGVNYAVLTQMGGNNGKILVRVQLVNLTTQQRTWSTSSEFIPVAVGNLMSQIVTGVVEATGVTPSDELPPQLSRDPQTMESFLKALLLLEQRNRESLTQAITLLDDAQRTDPSFTLATAYLAKAYVTLFESTGEVENQLLTQALQYGQSVLKNDPSNALANGVVGGVLRYIQKFDEADHYLDVALDAQPGNASAHREKAMIAVVKRNLSQAEGYAQRALKLDPKNPNSHVAVGIVHHFMRDFAGALQSYNNAITAGGDSDVITNRYRMSAWIAQGLIDQAVQYGMTLVENDPTDFRAYYWIGRALQLGGKAFESKSYLDQGIELAKKAIEANPNNWNAYSYFGLLYARSGKFDEGEKALDKAVELNPRSAQVLYRKAALFAIQNKKDQVFEWLKKATQVEFLYWEVLNSDFLLYGTDPGFASAVTVAQ